MSDFGYDRENRVSGIGDQLYRLDNALKSLSVVVRPSDGVGHLVAAARARIGPTMDAARAALDEAVLEQRAIAAERLGVEQRRVALARAALCRALKAMEGATTPAEDIEAIRAAIAALPSP